MLGPNENLTPVFIPNFMGFSSILGVRPHLKWPYMTCRPPNIPPKGAICRLLPYVCSWLDIFWIWNAKLAWQALNHTKLGKFRHFPTLARGNWHCTYCTMIFIGEAFHYKNINIMPIWSPMHDFNLLRRTEMAQGGFRFRLQYRRFRGKGG